MAKIFVFDSWRKHWSETIACWRFQGGHEIRTGIYWGPELTEWADIAIFHPVDNNLIQASKKQEKSKGTLIIAEAVDIDIYAGQPGAVEWDYVDRLVFMAEHMRDYSLAKFRIPKTLPIDVIPGGIDLNRWTLREKPGRGYQVAWVGRLWIAKNVFGAIQVFNQLIKADPDHPWRLFLRGEKYHPEAWWQLQVESYLDQDPELKRRVSFVPEVANINSWLEDKDFLLQTSFKEAFGYVIAQAAAKGIRPIIQMTTGAEKIWPRDWIFMTHDEAVRMFLEGYEPRDNRAFIAERYSVERRVELFDRICGLA